MTISTQFETDRALCLENQLEEAERRLARAEAEREELRAALEDAIPSLEYDLLTWTNGDYSSDEEEISAVKRNRLNKAMEIVSRLSVKGGGE